MRITGQVVNYSSERTVEPGQIRVTLSIVLDDGEQNFDLGGPQPVTVHSGSCRVATTSSKAAADAIANLERERDDLRRELSDTRRALDETRASRSMERFADLMCQYERAVSYDPRFSFVLLDEPARPGEQKPAPPPEPRGRFETIDVEPAEVAQATAVPARAVDVDEPASEPEAAASPKSSLVVRGGSIEVKPGSFATIDIGQTRRLAQPSAPRRAYLPVGTPVAFTRRKSGQVRRSDFPAETVGVVVRPPDEGGFVSVRMVNGGVAALTADVEPDAPAWPWAPGMLLTADSRGRARPWRDGDVEIKLGRVRECRPDGYVDVDLSGGGTARVEANLLGQRVYYTNGPNAVRLTPGDPIQIPCGRVASQTRRGPDVVVGVALDDDDVPDAAMKLYLLGE